MGLTAKQGTLWLNSSLLLITSCLRCEDSSQMIDLVGCILIQFIALRLPNSRRFRVPGQRLDSRDGWLILLECFQMVVWLGRSPHAIIGHGNLTVCHLPSFSWTRAAISDFQFVTCGCSRRVYISAGGLTMRLEEARSNEKGPGPGPKPGIAVL